MVREEDDVVIRGTVWRCGDRNRTRLRCANITNASANEVLMGTDIEARFATLGIADLPILQTYIGKDCVHLSVDVIKMPF
jgi:hypothetical protein